MKGEGRRIRDYPNKTIDFQFSKVLSNLLAKISMIRDSMNMKFDPHLKLYDEEEFRGIKFKIRMLYLEKREIKLKLDKYKDLFEINTDDLRMLGIRKETLKNFKK